MNKVIALLCGVLVCGVVLADGVGKVVSSTVAPTQVSVLGAKKVWVRNAGGAVAWISYNSTTNALKAAVTAGTAIPIPASAEVYLGDGQIPMFQTIEVACSGTNTATVYVGSWK